MISLTKCLTLSVPDEDYSRNVSCVPNWISIRFYQEDDVWYIMCVLFTVETDRILQVSQCF